MNNWAQDFMEIEKRIAEEGVEDFMNWPVIRARMLVGIEAPYIAMEHIALKKRWRDIVDKHGDDEKGNLIHQAYHIQMWESVTGKEVDELSVICEFGPGYGSLCYLIHAVGFEGDYYLIDNPAMHPIQRFYLGWFDIEPVWVKVAPEDTDLFIALYSLSEVSPAERHPIFMPHALIAYQNTYNYVDNQKYFEGIGKIRDACLRTKYAIR